MMTRTSQSSTTISVRRTFQLRCDKRVSGGRLRQHESNTSASAPVGSVATSKAGLRQPSFQVNGYLHPLFGVERALKKFPAYRASNGHQVPAIDCRQWFANPHRVALCQTLVKFGRRTFLIIFYHDVRVCVNASISGFVDLGLGNTVSCPPWHGEIAIFELGRHVSFLGRPGSKDILRKVLRLFLSRANEARLLSKEFPRELELLLA